MAVTRGAAGGAAKPVGAGYDRLLAAPAPAGLRWGALFRILRTRMTQLAQQAQTHGDGLLRIDTAPRPLAASSQRSALCAAFTPS